jgi:hypothetical protein
MRQEQAVRGDPMGLLDWRKILPFEPNVLSNHFVQNAILLAADFTAGLFGPILLAAHLPSVLSSHK